MREQPSRPSKILTLAFVLAAVTVEAGIVRQLSEYKTASIEGLAITDDGGDSFSITSGDPFGTNPTHAYQIFRWEWPGGAGSQVTSFSDGVWFSRYPRVSLGTGISVSDDGEWLVFVSRSDPLGQNHDRSYELFLMRPDGSGLAQLTDDSAVNAGSVYEARISGSGNRIVFISDSDPLGDNPNRHERLFVVDADGGNLTSLTPTATGVSNYWRNTGFEGISIDDNGSRIAFVHNDDLLGLGDEEIERLFKVQSDGTGLTELSVNAEIPEISGNGKTIAFKSGNHLAAVEWTGPSVGSWEVGGNFVESISIDDTGGTIYFSQANEIWRAVVGAPAVAVTSTTSIGHQTLALSGDGLVLAYQAWGSGIENNEDRGDELFVMSTADLTPLKLTDQENKPADLTPEIAASADRVIFGSSAKVWEGASGVGFELFSTSATGGTPEHIADYDLGETFSISDDGVSLVYLSEGAGGRFLDDSGEVFLPIGNDPHLSGNGTRIVHWASGDPLGTNPNLRPQIFALNSDGSGIAQISMNESGDTPREPRIDGTGTWTVYRGGSNDDGLNPDGSLEIFRARSDGADTQRITSSGYDSTQPDISGDGNRVVFRSQGDLVGSNTDHNFELFLYDAVAGTTHQLTDTDVEDVLYPRISRDGAYVAFSSAHPFTEGVPGGLREDVYRLEIASGTIERVAGPRDAHAVVSRPVIDDDGDRVAFAGSSNPTDENRDLNPQIFIADFSAPSRIDVSAATPTLVSWQPEPQPLRYDVIRGTVANLANGDANTIDLGPVVCLEDDSPDTTTVGFEDGETPGTGQVFFYLYRGTQGLLSGPGSWGRGTGDRERIAGAGACSP